MGPQNGMPPATGNFGTDLPQTEVPEQDLTVETNMAKFSKTEEFRKLKEAMLSRIEFYKQYAPGSSANPVAYRDMTNSERGWRTLVADVLIEEFNAIIGAYEIAEQLVKEAKAKSNTPK